MTSKPIDVTLLPNFPRERFPQYTDAEIVEVTFQRALPFDVGIDLLAAEDVLLRPGERAVVPTGVAIALPTEGALIEAQIRPRSGNAAKLGLTLLNTPGTIDPAYRGELGVILANMNLSGLSGVLEALALYDDSPRKGRDLYQTFSAWDKNSVQIRRGDKIAQLVLCTVVPPVYTWASALDGTERGTRGFGSTGLAGAA